MKRGGCWTGFNLRKMTIDRDLFALNRTSQSFTNLEIVCKLAFSTFAVCSDRSMIMYKRHLQTIE